MKHTKGPWRSNSKGHVTSKHGLLIHAPTTAPTDEVDLANARLIAAAPELLAALELLLQDNRLMNAMSREQSAAILDAVALTTAGDE